MVAQKQRMPQFSRKRALCSAIVQNPEHLCHLVGGELATYCANSMPICAHVGHVKHMHGWEWDMSQIAHAYRHVHARRQIPSSQASFCEAQTSPSPHTSIVHDEQPSQVLLLPSSQASPTSTTPLPHSSIRHVALQLSPSIVLPAHVNVSRRMHE